MDSAPRKGREDARVVSESLFPDGRAAFVVADVHGNLDALAGLLRQAGILDDDWERVDHNTLVVQMGDLCNCVVTIPSRGVDSKTPWQGDVPPEIGGALGGFGSTATCGRGLE